MEETGNPLEKIIVLTRQVRSYDFKGELEEFRRSDGHFLAFPAISWSLGRKPNESNGDYENSDLLTDYIALLNLIKDAERFIEEKSGERSRKTNISLATPLFAPYFSLSPTSHAEAIHAIHPTTIQNAQIVSDNLWEKNDTITVPEEDLKRLRQQISHLEAEIIGSKIDQRLKIRLLDTIGLLRISINRINLVGQQDVLEELEKLLGQSVMAVAVDDRENPEESKNLFSKTLQLFKDTKDVIDSASVIYPVLYGAAEIVKRALGGG